MTNLRVTYDREASAAYIYFGSDEGRRFERTVALNPQDFGGAMVNFDMDDDGRILGLEVLDAREMLAADVLNYPDR